MSLHPGKRLADILTEQDPGQLSATRYYEQRWLAISRIMIATTMLTPSPPPLAFGLLLQAQCYIGVIALVPKSRTSKH